MKTFYELDHVEDREVGAFGEQVVSQFKPQCGWTFAYSLNPDIVVSTLTGSGAATHERPFAKVATGATPGSTAKLSTIISNRYIPGMGAVAKFTAVFATPVVGTYQYMGPGDLTDGFFVGYDESAQFGFFVFNGGVKTAMYRADGWNCNEFKDIDPTMGNVYMIQYQWLGFGEQSLSIEDPATGQFRKAHRNKYANMYTNTSIANPNLPISILVGNGATSSNIFVKSPSGVVGVEGDPGDHILVTQLAVDASKTNVTTQVPILSVRNNSTFQSITNRLLMDVRELSIACSGTKATVFRMWKNATLTGDSFADVDATRLPLAKDTSASAISGGRMVRSWSLGRDGNEAFEYEHAALTMAPGDVFTITATSSAATDVFVSANLYGEL